MTTANSSPPHHPILEEIDWITAARRIAEQLEQYAVLGDDDELRWPSEHAPATDQAGSSPSAELDLNTGNAGVALFFAALFRMTQDSHYRALARQTLQPIRHLHYPSDEIPDLHSWPLGGATGIGSLVYTLTKCADLLDDDALLFDAEHAADLIRRTGIAHDRQHGLFSGAAGAIVGLLALHSVSGSRFALERARCCGEHLLEQRVRTPAGYRTWRTDGRFLTGCAHGAAGIALALIRLSDATENEQFHSAALEALAYERVIFDPQRGNWTDFHAAYPDAAPQFMSSWCNGAPGGGLMRAAMLAIEDDPQLKRELEIAIQTTCTSAPSSTDDVYSGEIGRAEILLEIGRLRGDWDLTILAESVAERVVRQAQTRGHYHLDPNPDENRYVPGFFTGLAGIGYTLLRLARPSALPCVLAWK